MVSPVTWRYSCFPVQGQSTAESQHHMLLKKHLLPFTSLQQELLLGWREGRKVAIKWKAFLMQLIECLPSLFLVRRGCLTWAVPGVGMKTCIPQQSKPYLGFTETSKLFPPVLLLVATLAPSFGHWLLPLLLPWSPACCQSVRSPVPRLVGFDMLSCMV